MSKSKIDLINKNGDKIIGVKLSDGTVGEISHTVDIKTHLIDCILPEGIMAERDGSYVFVLQNGKEFKEKLDIILDHSLDCWMGI